MLTNVYIVLFSFCIENNPSGPKIVGLNDQVRKRHECEILGFEKCVPRQGP